MGADLDFEDGGGRFPKSGDRLPVLIASPPTCPLPGTDEATMEIRTQSKTGPLVPPLADITTELSQQVDAVKQQWLDRLNRDPACFAHLEVEIHDRFRQLADQMTATLLAESTSSGGPAEVGKKGAPTRSTGHDGPRSRGG
jgi:hypothetical protein